jgi:hypothetical protein
MKSISTEDRLLKELRAARAAIRKMKANSNQCDENYEVGSSALKRINAVLNDYRRPVGLPASN